VYVRVRFDHQQPQRLSNPKTCARATAAANSDGSFLSIAHLDGVQILNAVTSMTVFKVGFWDLDVWFPQGIGTS
jgi:hypothetical protein